MFARWRKAAAAVGVLWLPCAVSHFSSQGTTAPSAQTAPCAAYREPLGALDWDDYDIDYWCRQYYLNYSEEATETLRSKEAAREAEEAQPLPPALAPEAAAIAAESPVATEPKSGDPEASVAAESAPQEISAGTEQAVDVVEAEVTVRDNEVTEPALPVLAAPEAAPVMAEPPVPEESLNAEVAAPKVEAPEAAESASPNVPVDATPAVAAEVDIAPAADAELPAPLTNPEIPANATEAAAALSTIDSDAAAGEEASAAVSAEADASSAAVLETVPADASSTLEELISLLNTLEELARVETPAEANADLAASAAPSEEAATADSEPLTVPSEVTSSEVTSSEVTSSEANLPAPTEPATPLQVDASVPASESSAPADATPPAKPEADGAASASTSAEESIAAPQTDAAVIAAPAPSEVTLPVLESAVTIPAEADSNKTSEPAAAAHGLKLDEQGRCSDASCPCHVTIRLGSDASPVAVESVAVDSVESSAVSDSSPAVSTESSTEAGKEAEAVDAEPKLPSEADSVGGGGKDLQDELPIDGCPEEAPGYDLSYEDVRPQPMTEDPTGDRPGTVVISILPGISQEASDANLADQINEQNDGIGDSFDLPTPVQTGKEAVVSTGTESDRVVIAESIPEGQENTESLTRTQADSSTIAKDTLSDPAVEATAPVADKQDARFPVVYSGFDWSRYAAGARDRWTRLRSGFTHAWTNYGTSNVVFWTLKVSAQMNTLLAQFTGSAGRVDGAAVSPDGQTPEAGSSVENLSSKPAVPASDGAVLRF